jgi:hypothetical protein
MVVVCLCLLQRAYRDHQAEKRMKDLIAEEEEAGRLEDERAAARAAADKEKRSKKKERKKVGNGGDVAVRGCLHTFLRCCVPEEESGIPWSSVHAAEASCQHLIM